MPLQQTSGNATADAFGGGVAAVPNYIEDVFSTYLYTGNSTARSIVNNIDLSGKGGLVWTKGRDSAWGHFLVDTIRGASKWIGSDTTAAQTTDTLAVTSFNSNGYSLGNDNNTGYVNYNASTYASWTFRKQPKFFDVVTYTGDGTSPRTVAHNLGSAPGMMFIKRTDSTSNWSVNANYLAANEYLNLNTTAAKVLDSTYWAGTRPSSTVFTLGTNSEVNASGGTYVAYLFAHNAGGFGLTGTDNVISCGSFTSDIAGVDINLGYEPQWVMVKVTNGVGLGWYIWDTMRGFVASTTGGNTVEANSSAAETGTNWISPTATGFKLNAGQIGTGNPFIYIAIRRGPMKVPTDATKVFEPVAYSGTGTNSRIITSSVKTDLVLPLFRNKIDQKYWYDRLRGNGTYVLSTGTGAELSDGAAYGAQFNSVQTGYIQGNSDSGFLNNSSYTYINYLFQRAPSFFDEVCYTGTGSATTVAHNLGAVPELIIVKERTITGGWITYNQTSGNTAYLSLNLPNAVNSSITLWNNTSPTSTVFTVGTGASVNSSGNSLVAYLFATCPGVSKVGSYTGNGTTQTINCGFTGGARFVLIKRTDATGDWYVYDTARGMTVLTDPYLLLNDTAAEVATLGSVTTVTTGFALNSAITAAINTNAGTYIFLAIA